MFLSGSVNTGIRYEGMSFLLWEAFIAAGSTPDQLHKLDQGFYPIMFQAKIVAWYQKHKLVKNNEQDAITAAQKRRSKRKS